MFYVVESLPADVFLVNFLRYKCAVYFFCETEKFRSDLNLMGIEGDWSHFLLVGLLIYLYKAVANASAMFLYWILTK